MERRGDCKFNRECVTQFVLQSQRTQTIVKVTLGPGSGVGGYEVQKIDLVVSSVILNALDETGYSVTGALDMVH